MKYIREIIEIYLNKRVPRSAAELSYCLMLSIFPMLICLNAMLASFNLSENAVIEYGQGIIPASALKIIAEYVDYVTVNYSPTMLIAALLLVATTSSAAFRAILNIMSEIQGQPRYKGFWSTIVSFIYSLLFLISVYISCFVIFAGNWFLKLLVEYFDYRILSALWRTLRFVLLFVILFTIIYGIYRLTAPREKPRQQRLVGAVLAAIALVIASMFFSWTIEMSVRYPLIYGSIASIIILMIWLFICGNILICGNVINVVFNRHYHAGRNQSVPVDQTENDGRGHLGK